MFDQNDDYLESQFISSWNKIADKLNDPNIVICERKIALLPDEDFFVNIIIKTMKYCDSENIPLAQLVCNRIKNFNNSLLDKSIEN